MIEIAIAPTPALEGPGCDRGRPEKHCPLARRGAAITGGSDAATVASAVVSERAC